MDLSKLVPLHRIEIRRAGSKKSEPWTVAELAHTAEHLAVKLGFWKKQDDIEVRTVNNFLVAAADVVAAVPAVVAAVTPAIAAVTAMTKNPSTSPAPAVATAPGLVITPAAGSPDSVTGATPLPFGVGDFLRDVHTGVKVRVTAINPDGRAGFSWEKTTERVEGDTDHTGFCPLASVGAFAPATEKSAATAEPTGVETAAPEVKPPAADAPKPPRVRKAKAAKPAKPAAPAKVATPTAAPKTPRASKKKTTAAVKPASRKARK